MADKFRFSKRSLANLEGVEPILVDVVKVALDLHFIDFAVVEGIRTLERQAKLLADGMTRTMQSKHLVGKAVDLVPWVAGSTSYRWVHIAELAKAMQTAAAACGVELRWGGVWDRKLSVLDEDLAAEVLDYQTRVPKPFLDGPHYELA